jgi:hypothetical protein
LSSCRLCPSLQLPRRSSSICPSFQLYSLYSARLEEVVSGGELRYDGSACIHLCTHRITITSRSLRRRRNRSARLYVFISSLIDIIIYASTFATLGDEDTGSSHRLICPKRIERWSYWKKIVGRGTVLQAEDEHPSMSGRA